MTLKLREYLEEKKYRALVACTIDGRSYFNSEREENVYRLKPSLIPQAEKIIGRQIRIVSRVEGEVQSGAGRRPKQSLALAVDVDHNWASASSRL